MIRKLKRLRMDEKEYFIDERLHQIRNVKNPHDYEDVSPGLIDFWVNHCEMRGDNLVCDLKNISQKENTTSYTVQSKWKTSEEWLPERTYGVKSYAIHKRDYLRKQGRDARIILK